MYPRSTVRELIAGVQVYADADAFRRADFGRPLYVEMNPLHDDLYQRAIDLRLANALIVMQRKPPLPGLRGIFEVAVERPKWHPANLSPSRNNLLIAPVAAFQRNWLSLRLAAETPPKSGQLWHDDPALIFEPSPGVFMCRTACIGHEGQVLYFAYRNEREWLTTLARSSLPQIGAGDASYLTYLPKAGVFAE